VCGRQEGGPSVAGGGWRVLWWTVGGRLVWVGRLVVVAGGGSSRRRWTPSSVKYVGDAPAHIISVMHPPIFFVGHGYACAGIVWDF